MLLPKSEMCKIGHGPETRQTSAQASAHPHPAKGDCLTVHHPPSSYRPPAHFPTLFIPLINPRSLTTLPPPEPTSPQPTEAHLPSISSLKNPLTRLPSLLSQRLSL